MYLKDPKTGEPSVTMTMMVIGFVIASIKYLSAGVVVGSVTLGASTGGDFAAVIGALGAIYAARKHSDGMNE